MRKSVLAAALAAVVMLSGCSGVSQEEYNSLIEENSRLQEANTSLENENEEVWEKNDTLSKQYAALEEEYTKLKNNKENQTSQTQGNTSNTINENFSYDNIQGLIQNSYTTSSGDKWYYLGNNIFVTYIDDESYKGRDDELLILFAHADMLLNIMEYYGVNPPSAVAFIFMEKNGVVAASGATGFYNGVNLGYYLEWSGKYEYLNSHPKQLELFKQD